MYNHHYNNISEIKIIHKSIYLYIFMTNQRHPGTGRSKEIFKVFTPLIYRLLGYVRLSAPQTNILRPFFLQIEPRLFKDIQL